MSYQPLYTAVATVVSGREGHGETSDGNVQVNFNATRGNIDVKLVVE